MLDNRELATVIWALLSVILATSIPRLRRFLVPMLRPVVRAMFQRSIVAFFGAFLVWSVLMIALAARIGLWDIGLLKDSVVVTVTMGFPLLFRAVTAKSGTAIVRELVSETIAFSAILTAYLNLESFPLWAELVLLPALTATYLLVVAANRSTMSRLRGCLHLVLTSAAALVIVWTSAQLISTAATRNWSELASEVALSVWLPFTFFPYLYGVSFIVAAEKIARRMRRYNPPARKSVVLAALLGLHLRLRWASAFLPTYEKPVSRSGSFREAREGMISFREGVRREEEEERGREAAVVTLAGEPGADARGEQIDRREFSGTKRALNRIVTAQALRYRQPGRWRYWDDLTELTLSPLSDFGLPEDHRIVVQITPDRQQWRAWRQLPNGWFLGVGGRDNRGGHYLYSGPTAPTTWPGGPGWADTATDPELPADWVRSDAPGL